MTSFSFDDLVTDDKKTNTSSSTTSSTLPFSSLAPNQYNPNAQEIVNPTFPEKEPYVSAEEQMEALNLSQAQEQEPETISIKDLEEDYESILQYRLDRFGTEKTAGSDTQIIGNIFGEQELTPANLVDDYLDHIRGMQNSLNAVSEINWIRGLKRDEKEAMELYESSPEGSEEKMKALDKANEIAAKRVNALKLYQKANKIGGFFDSKRYEGMDFLESVGDVIQASTMNVASVLSDPITALSMGAGRVVGGIALKGAGVTPLNAAMKAALTAAPIEAGGAVLTDVAIQNAEIEMGARKNIDYKRLGFNAALAASTAGVITGVATHNVAKRVDKATRGDLTKALQKVTAQQVALAKQTNKTLNVNSKDIREKIAEGVEDIYGKAAIIRSSDGTLKGFDSAVIKNSEQGQKAFADIDIDEELYDVSISTDTLERVTASVAELIEQTRAGKIKFKDTITNAKIKDYSQALGKNEKVSERLLGIMSDISEESFDFTTGILGKYGITQRELAANLFVDASRAGKTLGELSKLSKIIGRTGRTQSVLEAADEAADKIMHDTLTPYKFFRRLEDIRRLTLVSGVATATRNNISQVLRSGVDTLVTAFEQAINPRMRKGLAYSKGHSIFSQLEHTFYDQKDAATITQFLLDLTPKSKARFYNQYSEVKNTLRKNNPGQSALTKQKKGLSGVINPVLDKWEDVVTTLNFFNRYQEALYRNGMFTASVQRQLYNKGIDMYDVLKSGTITQNISEDIIAKAVDDALDFTYASAPKFAPFRGLNDILVKSVVGTQLMPFPRFTFKALEMTYNYNVFGLTTGIIRALGSKAMGKEVTDGMYRQIAEGVAGGLPLLTLGYLLTDPDGDVAGSEWYLLKDGMGNEFDARPFFPLTPYLLFGSWFHRIQGDLPIKPHRESVREAVEGLTGANFRGAGAISLVMTDILNSFMDEPDELKLRSTWKRAATYLGEIASGYGQPIYQVADLFGDHDERVRDYKENKEYGEGLMKFFGPLADGLLEPSKKRLGRVVEAIGGGDLVKQVPYSRDPRTDRIPERVMPFMKIFFGATLNRIPPKYVTELARMGFGYDDFMSKSIDPEINRYMNREMGITMNEKMPLALHSVKELFPDSIEQQQLALRGFITNMKSILYADMKTKNVDLYVNSMINEYKRQGFYGQRGSKIAFKKEFKREPDLTNEQDLEFLLSAAKSIRSSQF
jgi:hypothetical protein